MKVYHKGARVRRQPSFTMCVAPASDVAGMEIPPEWFEPDGKPRQFNIMFLHGEAEVEDSIGSYLLSKNYVQRTRLFLPPAEPEPEVAGLDPAFGG